MLLIAGNVFTSPVATSCASVSSFSAIRNSVYDDSRSFFVLVAS